MEGPTATELQHAIEAARLTAQKAIRYDQSDAFDTHLVERLKLIAGLVAAADSDFLGHDAAFMQSIQMASFARLGQTVIRGYLTGTINIQHVRREP